MRHHAKYKVAFSFNRSLVPCLPALKRRIKSVCPRTNHRQNKTGKKKGKKKKKTREKKKKRKKKDKKEK